MTEPTNQQSTTSISSPAHKRPRTVQEPETNIRLEENFVPLYKAYRKASVSQAKAGHHLDTLLEYKNQRKIPKAFKINIKPQVPTPTTELIIDWETAASTFGHELVKILVTYWEKQKSSADIEVSSLSERLSKIPSEQAYMIQNITSRIVSSTLSQYKEKWSRNPKETGETENPTTSQA